MIEILVGVATMMLTIIPFYGLVLLLEAFGRWLDRSPKVFMDIVGTTFATVLVIAMVAGSYMIGKDVLKDLNHYGVIKYGQ